MTFMTPLEWPTTDGDWHRFLKATDRDATEKALDNLSSWLLRGGTAPEFGGRPIPAKVIHNLLVVHELAWAHVAIARRRLSNPKDGFARPT